MLCSSGRRTTRTRTTTTTTRSILRSCTGLKITLAKSIPFQTLLKGAFIKSSMNIVLLLVVQAIEHCVQALFCIRLGQLTMYSPKFSQWANSYLTVIGLMVTVETVQAHAHRRRPRLHHICTSVVFIVIADVKATVAVAMAVAVQARHLMVVVQEAVGGVFQRTYRHSMDLLEVAFVARAR